MSKTELICRFCLKLPDSEAVEVDEVARQMFDVFQMELDFNVFENSIMCKDCSETIERLYAFKSLCMDTQDLILLSNVQQNRCDIDLRNIYKAKTDSTLDKDADVCRLCMKPSREDGLISTDALNIDITFVEMWTKYMTEVNLQITKNPKICFNCKDNIQCYFKFMLDIKTVEGKINTYRETVERGKDKPILFSNAVKYLCLDTLGSSKELSQMCTIKKEDVTEVSTNNLCQEVSEIKSGNGDDHIPKLENVLVIKEEKVDCEDENETLSIGCQLNDREMDRDGPCTCGKCNGQCTVPNEKEGLKQHSNKHKDPSELKVCRCSHCPFETHWRGTLNRHIRSKHKTSETYKCSQCSYTTTYENFIKRHMAVHDSSIVTKMHECTICDYKSKFKRSLDKHMMLNHTDKSELRTYKCFKCEFETFWKDEFRRHVLVHRDDGKAPKYSCTICPYFSNYISALRRHTLVHKSSTEVEMHECAICGFKTKLAYSLTTHMKTHKKRSELQMYKCQDCSYETHKRAALTTHALVHKGPTETQMYYCTICTFGTRHKYNLKAHVLKHNKVT